MISFKIVPNQGGSGEAVEVHKDGEVVATIHPGRPGHDLQIFSAHFAGDLATGDRFPAGIKMSNGERFVPVPAVKITFDRRPYEIHPGQNTITRPNDEAEKKRARDSIGPGFRGPGGAIY
jgi:hypothetical protein